MKRNRYVLGASGAQYPSPSPYFHVVGASLTQSSLTELLKSSADVYLLQGLYRTDVDMIKSVLGPDFQPTVSFPSDPDSGDWGDGHGLCVVTRVAMWRVSDVRTSLLKNFLTEDEAKAWKDCGACRSAVEALCGVLSVTLRMRSSAGGPITAAVGRLSAWHVGDGAAAKTAQSQLLTRCINEAVSESGSVGVILGGEWNSAEEDASGRLLLGQDVHPADPEHPLQSGWESMSQTLRSPLPWPLVAPKAPVAHKLVPPLLVSSGHLASSALVATRNAAQASCAYEVDLKAQAVAAEAVAATARLAEASGSAPSSPSK